VKMGAEPKKVAALAGLCVIALIVFYVNSGSSAPDAAPSVRTPVSNVSAPAPTARGDQRRQPNARGTLSEFKPRQGVRDPKDKPDPATIDPTLRLDLLAKLQSVMVGPPGRNIFQTGAAPEVKPVVLPKNVPKIVTTPPPTAPPPTGPPPPPSAPPMTFKYYGFTISKANGRKSAFLLDGEEILIAGENDTVKRRYRVVRIGVNSITIEDTQFKSTQTLQLQENLAG